MEQSLGQRLASLRAQRGLTQEELATAAGINRPRISLLENDEVEKPRGGTMQKLAVALGVSLRELEGPKLIATRTLAPPKPYIGDKEVAPVVAESADLVFLRRENEFLRERLEIAEQQSASLREQLSQALEQLKNYSQQLSFVRELVKQINPSFSLDNDEAVEQPAPMWVAA